MTADPQVQLRFTRLENEAVSIYELLAGIRTTADAHTQRFEGIETTLQEVLRRLPVPSS